MRDIVYSDQPLSDPDPVKRAQNAMARQVLPRRFYAEATIVEEDGRFAIKLDGRGARTPGKNILSLPTHLAAYCLAREWNEQVEVINPHLMPATRIVNTALDGVSAMMAEVGTEIADFAGSDLVCYRAADPPGLVRLQDQHWNPVTDWARDVLGARFVLAQGIIHASQSPEALAKVKGTLSAYDDPVALACLHVLTTLSGSCLIALMAASGAASGEAAWQAATVDEVWNNEFWGQDEEAAVRIARRKEESTTALGLLRAVAWVERQPSP
jgi:chaperone required for assembly of F1-ATPase